MKALSIIQPWATLIAVGAKTIETRSWGTSYRGLLAIHASKKLPPNLNYFCLDGPFRAVLDAAGYTDPERSLPRGSIVAVVRLVECIRLTTSKTYRFTSGRCVVVTAGEEEFGDFTPGRYGWVLEMVEVLDDPIPARGSHGLWEWTALDGGEWE